MFSLLREFISRIGMPVRIIVMDDDPNERPRQHQFDPGRFLWVWFGTTLFVTALLLAVILLTPVRSVLPGYTTQQMQRDARLNRLRLRAMEDSLRRQDAYLHRLRDMMLGQIDTSGAPVTAANRVPSPVGVVPDVPLNPSTESWEDHQQPALPIDRLSALSTDRPRAIPAGGGGRFLSGLTFPILPPVSGLVSRQFEARAGHFAVDLVVEEGSVVRSIGDGYVILADWTHDGGQIIVVQHADGYLSVYKHNSSLLKRVGDAVRSRDAIALSGNSGEITTGPHLHFELWHNGLAQDPQYYMIGL